MFEFDSTNICPGLDYAQKSISPRYTHYSFDFIIAATAYVSQTDKLTTLITVVSRTVYSNT
jgi:hypothetical protein